jgi:localization factor PodJL
MAIPAKLLALARAGEFMPQIQVAELLMSSESPAGYQRALPWLQRLAQRGEPWADYHLGFMYDKGLGVRRNLSRAIAHYELSAAKKYGSAELNLGILLANLPGRQRDLKRAMQLYRRAVRRGRWNAAYNLGMYYAEGRGVRRNLALARKWYALAASQGDADSARKLEALGRPKPRSPRSC